jgi:glycerate 2-kinase
VKIVVAPDKFKGSLTAREAGDAIRRGLLRVWPDALVDVVPVADGGDGTAEALLSAVGGRRVERDVHGPDGRLVHAWFALLGDGSTAVVEMATASGLALVPGGSNDPLVASSAGTGELIAAALDAGARRILLAIGGSATNDAGAGALSALGARFLDRDGRLLPPGGGALIDLFDVDVTTLREKLTGVAIDIACDVDNPLLGSTGASAVYGPQKGASPEDVRSLDAALSRFADVVESETGCRFRDVPGAGAAGGVGGGFLALAGARLLPGAALVLEVIGFERRLEGVSLVVTGEGRLDRQTLAGKAPFAVTQAARKREIPVVAIAGAVDLSSDDLEALGIQRAEAISTGGMPIEEAMRRADELTANAAERVAGELGNLQS